VWVTSNHNSTNTTNTSNTIYSFTVCAKSRVKRINIICRRVGIWRSGICWQINYLERDFWRSGFEGRAYWVYLYCSSTDKINDFDSLFNCKLFCNQFVNIADRMAKQLRIPIFPSRFNSLDFRSSNSNELRSKFNPKLSNIPYIKWLTKCNAYLKIVLPKYPK